MTLEELRGLSPGVEDRALCATDAVLHLGPDINGLAEGLVPDLFQWYAVRVDEEAERDGADPWLSRRGQATFRRASVGNSSARQTRESLGDNYLVQVPLALGRVTPEKDSISEDFPAL